MTIKPTEFELLCCNWFRGISFVFYLQSEVKLIVNFWNTCKPSMELNKLWLSRKNPQTASWHIALLKLCAPSHSVLSLLGKSMYTSTAPQATSSKCIIQFNQHPSETVSTKTQHYNLHRGRIYCTIVVFGCSISLNYVYIKWQLSVSFNEIQYVFFLDTSHSIIHHLIMFPRWIICEDFSYVSVRLLGFKISIFKKSQHLTCSSSFYRLKFVYSCWRILLHMWGK